MYGMRPAPASSFRSPTSTRGFWGSANTRNPYNKFLSNMNPLQQRYGGYTTSLFQRFMASPYAGGKAGGTGGSSWGYSSGYPGAGDPRVTGHMRHLMGGQRRQVQDLAKQMRPGYGRGFAVRGGADPYAQAQRQAMDTVARGYADRYGRAMDWARQEHLAGMDAWKTMAGLLPSLQSNELGAYNLGLQARQQQNARIWTCFACSGRIGTVTLHMPGRRRNEPGQINSAATSKTIGSGSDSSGTRGCGSSKSAGGSMRSGNAWHGRLLSARGPPPQFTLTRRCLCAT